MVLNDATGLYLANRLLFGAQTRQVPDSDLGVAVFVAIAANVYLYR
jgi:hypothetical protein